MVTTVEENKTSGAAGKGRSRKTPAKSTTAPKKERKQRTPMTDEHKEALALGRSQGKVVDRYLTALELHKPKRGRKVTPESLQKKLTKIETELETATGADRLNLMQEAEDIREVLASGAPESDITALQAEFVKVAAAYASRRGIQRSTFQKYGVPLPVLKEAGL